MIPVLLGVAGGYIGKKIYDRTSEVSKVDWSNCVKPSIEDDYKILLKALSATMGVAARANGELKAEEKSKFEDFKNSFNEKYDVDNEFIIDLNRLFEDENITLSDLEERYSAITLNENDLDDIKGTINDSIDDVIKSDGSICISEKAFKFQINLLLDKQPCIDLIYCDGDSGNVGLNVAYKSMGSMAIREKYPNTEEVLMTSTGFLVPHPVDSKRLVSFEYLLSKEFINSKDAELLEVAREAGAKKIKIINISNDTLSSKYNKEVSLSGGNLNADIKGGVSSQELTLSERNSFSHVEYEFEGKQGSILKTIKSIFKNPSDELLRNSIYLKNDEQAITFVKNCFSENKMKKCMIDITFDEIAKSSMVAKTALECNLLTSNSGGKGLSDNELERMISTKWRYEVLF